MSERDDALAVRRQFERFRARRDQEAERLGDLQNGKRALEVKDELHNEVIPILLSIAHAYRAATIGRVEKLVTMAIQAVFEHPYEFKFVQENKRGQVELLPSVHDGKNVFDPLGEKGNGIVDVLSIALRISIWSLVGRVRPGQVASDPILVFDEPAQNVNSDSGRRNLTRLFHDLADALGIQIVIVTNRSSLSEGAGRTFQVVMENGVSRVETVGV